MTSIKKNKLCLKNSSEIFQNDSLIYFGSCKENHLHAVTEKMYVCRYVPAVKPPVASNENDFTLGGGEGILAIEDKPSL
jgi:hypothetical protein